MNTTTDTAFSAARDFFTHRIAPYEPGDTIELRSFDPHDGKPGPRAWHTNAAEAARDAVDLARRYNVYASVNPRIDGGGKKDHVTAIVSLHGELDDQKFPGGRAGILAALAQLPPTLLIDSGGGVHPRWDLTVPLRLDDDPEQRASIVARVENLMRRIYRFLGRDAPPDSVQDVSRILRIPGTLNRKPEYSTPRPVTVLAYDPGRRYDVDSLDALLPALPIVPPKAHPVHGGHPPVSADDRAVLDHARAAKNGAKFARLYDAGDTSGHTSHSEARQAICSLLAFWCEHDQDQCARLFQGSALCREDKWPRERERVLALAYSRGDFYRWPARQERVPLSTLDTPPVAGALAEYLAMPHDTLAQLAADQAAAIAERDRRLDALDELLTSKDMLPVDRIVAYGVVKAGAVAQRQQTGDEPARDLVVNQKAIACAINVSRQTVGGKLRQWGDQGHLGKATRPTGQRAKAGDEILETVIQLPARSLTDNIMCAATWTRPPDAPHVGGNGNRCPKCNGATTKKAIETKTIETTTLSCADCGHVHTQTQRTIGRPTTTYSFSDDTTPPVLDLAAIRGKRGVASVDTPPVAESTPKDCDTGVHPATPPRGVAGPDRSEPPPLDPAIAGNLAGCHDAADIAAHLARLRERWAVGDRTPTVRAAIDDWEAIAVARAALDAQELVYATGGD